MKGWDLLSRRIESAQQAVAAIRPAPDPDDHVDWVAILSPEDKERLRVIREHYLARPEPRGKLVDTATDDEIDFLAEVAERIVRWKEEHPAPT